MSVRRLSPSTSPFDALEQTFARLVRGSGALTVSGWEVGGLPGRSVPLDELRAILLHPSSSYDLRDTVLGQVVARAQDDAAWMVGLCGLLLPGLRSAVWPLSRAFPQRSQDLEAEMLAALVVAARRVEAGRARLASHLTWKARDGAKRLLRTEMGERARPADDPVPATPPSPGGHPDQVLVRAVRLGILQAEDAELIGATRLGSLALRTAAEALGISYVAARKRRVRAERVLVAWLVEEADPDGFVPAGTGSDRSSVGMPPRRGRPRVRRPELRRFEPSTRR